MEEIDTRGRQGLAAVVTAALLLVTATACDSGGSSPEPPVAGHSTAGDVGSHTAHRSVPLLRHGPVASLHLLHAFHTGFAQTLAVAPDAVWTAGGDSVPAITRIDPGTGRMRRVRIPDTGPRTVVTAGGWIWVRAPEGLFRVDLLGSGVTPWNRRETGVAAGFGSVWLATSDRLQRVDARTGRLVSALRVPGAYAGGEIPSVSVGLGSVWWPTQEKTRRGRLVTELYRVSPKTNTVVASTRIPGDDVALLVAGDRAWVKTGADIYDAASPEDVVTMLQRFDPGANRLVPRSKVRLTHAGASAVSATAQGDHLWFPTTTGDGPDVGKLLEFDARRGRVLRAFDLSQGRDCGYNAVAFAFGSLWAASGVCERVTRWRIP